MSVVTRFAPSPTGLLHAGNYRTAVFAYLFARRMGGTFILRIEDTDRERWKKEYEENILESLAWLGLEHDSFYRQSEHKARHHAVLEKLIADGHAYISKEASQDQSKRNEVIRFKNPNTPVSFTDMIRGTVTMDTTDLGDFVIAKSLSEPLFHLAVVVDDWDEGVTHVVRGEDHISNTPRQVLIQRAIGAPTPFYAHLPLVLGTDRSKLSKRKGAKPLLAYRDLGYLPQALLNYMAFIGWNPGGAQEIFTKDELASAFTLEAIQKGSAIFDEVKLAWFNREHMLRLTPEAFWEHAEEFLSQETVTQLDTLNLWKDVVPVMRERASTFGDIRAADEAGEYQLFYKDPVFEPSLLLWKEESSQATKARLERILSLLEGVPDPWTAESVKSVVWDYAEKEGRGQVLWPMRASLSGREKSPDPFTISGIIGRDDTIRRIASAISLLHP